MWRLYAGADEIPENAAKKDRRRDSAALTRLARYSEMSSRIFPRYDRSAEEYSEIARGRAVDDQRAVGMEPQNRGRHILRHGPFAMQKTASALFAPLARMRTRLACIICRMPIVNAFLGTSSMPAKRRALSLTVLSASVTTCVPLSNGVPGSLKAICPLLPNPKSWTSRGRERELYRTARTPPLLLQPSRFDIGVFKIDIQPVKQVVPHKTGITLRMRSGQSFIFVQIDGADVEITRAVLFMIFDQCS